MNKLTSPDYRLPIIEALNPFDFFDAGTTVPLGVFGVDRVTGERGQYVVKMKYSERMSTASSAYELIGAWMAMELDLPVVEPVLIHISSDFAETSMLHRDGYRTALQSQGLNFGSKYQSGYSNLPPNSMTFSARLMETAQQLYVFDIFIGNTDRGHQKPNILFNGSDFLIFDHELSFSFSRVPTFLRNLTPWIFNELDRDLHEKHVFNRILKSTRPDLTPQVQHLKCFDAAFWDKVYRTLPPEWIDDQVSEIAPYLTSILENDAYFADSLNRTLS